MTKAVFVLVVCSFVFGNELYSQDSQSLLGRISNFPNRVISKIDRKINKLEEQVYASSEKALKKLYRQEARLQRKLARKDSLAAVKTFGDVNRKYEELLTDLKQGSASKINAAKQYLPFVDTLKTSLKFLSQGSSVLSNASGELANVNKALSSVSELQAKLQQADAIRNYIKERRALLKQQLDKYGLGKSLLKYNKQVYYYSQQIKEYKDILQDPGKLERKALGLLQKLPAFQKFLKEHSELASLFPMPENYGTAQALQGLQTRAGVQQMIQQQIGSAGPNAQAMMQQNIQQAKSQITQLQEKINKAGGSNSDFEVPDFKPNSQKTKSFLKRIELGTNLQSTKSNGYFPVTSDIGLSVGYKLNDKGVIGVGGSYKLGLGKDIRHIVFTHEGIGVRSFVDWKLKGSFYISGGYEQNYRQRFENIQQLKGISNWQQSGLVGLSKILSVKSKVFKKTKVQLLWDFLSYQQVPRTQAVLFRVGYGFK